MQRIVVVGVTGSGKSTFARALSARLDVPHVELDALYWGPHWQAAPAEVFRTRAAEALQGEAWVADGNYSRLRDLTWQRADTLVWLDYPLPLILLRLLYRTVRRVVLQERLWAGNRERFAHQFLSRESLILWALRTHARYRAEYPVLLREPAYRHLRAVRLRGPRQAAAWLAHVAPLAAETRPDSSTRGT